MLPLRVFLGIFVVYTGIAAICQLRLPDRPQHSNTVLTNSTQRTLAQPSLLNAHVVDHTFFKTAVTPSGIRLVADPVTCKWHLSGELE